MTVRRNTLAQRRSRARQRARRLDGIACPLCEEIGFIALGRHLVSRHGLTSAEFRKCFSDHPVATANYRGVRRDLYEDHTGIRWTRRAIVSAMRRWAKKHGRPPTFRGWYKGGYKSRPCTKQVVHVFGSWSAGLRAAGLPVPPQGSAPRETCKRGHPLADAYVRRDGARVCRECRKLHKRRHRQRAAT